MTITFEKHCLHFKLENQSTGRALGPFGLDVILQLETRSDDGS